MTPQGEQRSLWRFRILAALLLLTALCFHQAPGLVVPDTKLDLTSGPGAFLGRALHMWDPQGAFGQLQNQAYGYLFPVGPFHWLLGLAGVPEWVVQRLWWSLLLGLAFVGYWKVAGALRLGDPWARYLGALLYALTPRLLGEVAITSVEVWPVAMAPWVLLPLVTHGARSWAWRISWSALAFLGVGGVNAVASGATLVLPALWFLTRDRLRQSAMAFAAWLVAVLAVSLWWLVPLVLLGRYSPPFLDWIEDAAVTTSFASPFHALSGTTPWLAFLAGASGPSWPAGWEYVTGPVFILLAAGVAALSLVGLSARRLPEATFLRLGVLVGLVLVTLGFTKAGASPVGPTVQTLLDGALAPLRNTHKFELVVRLPLLLAAAHAVAAIRVRLSRFGLASWVAPVMAVSLVAALAAPGIAGSMPRPEGYVAIPGYWRAAATWLDTRHTEGSVLLAPAASFADFAWGSTKDEPLQALMTRPFAVRDAVPLGSAGTTRMLDVVQQRLTSGRGGADVREALRRSGVRYLVLRNDLRLDAVDNVGLQVHQALAESGMPAPVQSFGPRVAGALESGERTLDSRTRLPYPSVEIFDLGPVDAATVVPAADVVTAVGGSEDGLRVLAPATGPARGAGATTPAPGAMLTGTDASGAAAALGTRGSVLTDGNVRREVFFGRSSDNRSAPLTADDPGRTDRRVTDFDADPAAPKTTRVWEGGLVEVTASSSASDANATLRLGSAHSPAAAVDGRPETSWVSGRYGRARGEWLQLRFTEAVDVQGTSVRLPLESPAQGVAAELLAQTDGGEAVTVLAAGAAVQRLQVPKGPTTTLRIVVRSLSGRPDASGVSIAEVAVPGLDLGSRLQVPAVPTAPDTILLGQTSPATSGCAQVGDRPLCSPTLVTEGEEQAGFRRLIQTPSTAAYQLSGTVVARDGTAAERLLADLTAVTATASSRAVNAPGARPAAAFDGSLGTGWVADIRDPRPRLTARFPSRVTTGELQLQVDQYLAASRASEVQLTFDGVDDAAVVAPVDDAGFVRWAPRTFRSLSIQFLATNPLVSIDSRTGLSTELPVGVSEVRLEGVSPAGRASAGELATGAPCGFGPELVVAGRRIPTTVDGTVDDVLTGAPLQWRACTPEQTVTVPSGQVAVDALASAEFVPLTLRLTRATDVDPHAATAPARGSPTAVTVRRHGPASMTATLAGSAPTAALLVLPQNFNEGWSATTADGIALEPLRVNGWQQGWVLPAGTVGRVQLAFGPDTGYRIGLLLGGLLALACGAAAGATAVWRGRTTTARGPGSIRRVLVVPAAVAPAVVPVRAAAVVVLALSVVLAGLTGLVAGLSALGLAWVLAHRPARVSALAGALLVAAGAWAAADPWPTGGAGAQSWAVQALALTGVALACSPVAVAASPSLSGRSPGPRAGLSAELLRRRPRRMMGRSIR